MKVALVTEFFPKSPEREMRGGVEARTYYIAKELAKKHEVTIYCTYEDESDKVRDFDGFKVLGVGRKAPYTHSGGLLNRFFFTLDAIKKLRKKRYDIVDGCAVMGYIPAWFSKGKKRLITYHDLWVGKWIHNVGFAGILGEVLERIVLSFKWDKIIAVSKYTKDNLIRYGVDAENIVVASNGISVSEYEKIKSEKYDKPTVCAIARLVRYKRLDDLLYAIKKLKVEIPDIQAKVIGSGPDLERLEKISEKLGIKDCVEFTGFVQKHDDALRILKSSHVFCLPSEVEGFGITVVEAMALDIPYVASDIAAVREATKGGLGGILYPVGDVQALAEGVKKFLNKEIDIDNADIRDYDWGSKAEIVSQTYESLF